MRGRSGMKQSRSTAGQGGGRGGETRTPHGRRDQGRRSEDDVATASRGRQTMHAGRTLHSGREAAEPMRPEEPARGSVLYLPRALLQATHAAFGPYVQAGVEMAAWWCGVEAGETGGIQIVTTLALPRLLHQTPGSYQIDGEAQAELAAEFAAQGLVILAQVHTHPAECSVRHSPYDDQHAYSTRDGSLSFVWPAYGAPLSGGLVETGIGVHERRDDRWVLLPEHAVVERVRLVESLLDRRWRMRVGMGEHLVEEDITRDTVGGRVDNE